MSCVGVASGARAASMDVVRSGQHQDPGLAWPPPRAAGERPSGSRRSRRFERVTATRRGNLVALHSTRIGSRPGSRAGGSVGARFTHRVSAITSSRTSQDVQATSMTLLLRRLWSARLPLAEPAHDERLEKLERA